VEKWEKIDDGHAQVQQVLPDGLPGTAVDQREVPLFQADRESLEIFLADRGQFLPGPEVGDTGFSVEVIQRQKAQGGPVVVARHADVLKVLNAGHAFVGVRAVPDQVPQAPDHIKGGRVPQHRFQCSAIGVDVGDDQVAHRIHSGCEVAILYYTPKFPLANFDKMWYNQARKAGVVQLVERLLAKEKATGSSPVARSANMSRRRSQVVRQGSAKPSYVGSNPTAASWWDIEKAGSPEDCPFLSGAVAKRQPRGT
jgi:hypothetical protein